jgi:hypothetical protein
MIASKAAGFQCAIFTDARAACENESLAGDDYEENNMKGAALVAALALSLAGPVAFADDPPQLTGTWKGKIDGISMKGGYIDGEVMLVVTEQKGRSFKGQYTYPVGDQQITADIIGTIDSDGDRIYFLGTDGHNTVQFKDGVMQDCYVSDNSSVAACMDLTKQ